MSDTAQARGRMVERQIRRRGITDPRVIEAVGAVPRERFVPDDLAEFAYEDGPLPIAAGQTISQPYIVALMLEAAGLAPGDRALEVGTGSGYAAALMSRLATRVFTVERHAELAETARVRLAAEGYGNVEVRTGDGSEGWPEAAPFDAILVAAGGPTVPEALRRQLAPGGRLVMPVGGRRPGRGREDQRLLKVTRTGEDAFAEEDLGGVLFVPLVGRQGWSETSRPGGRAPAR